MSDAYEPTDPRWKPIPPNVAEAETEQVVRVPDAGDNLELAFIQLRNHMPGLLRRPVGEVDRLTEQFPGLVSVMVATLLGGLLLVTSLEQPGEWQPNLHANPTPNGYAWGLGIYVAPIVACVVMMLRVRASKYYWMPLVLAVFGLFGALLLIDITAVGATFFTFPNNSAYLHLSGGVDLMTQSWVEDAIPIEDVLFYAVALFAAMLVYSASSLAWFPTFSPYVVHQQFRRPSKVWAVVWRRRALKRVVLVGLLMAAAGVALHAFATEACGDQAVTRVMDWSDHLCPATPMAGRDPELTAGPWYFLFLVLTGVVPTAFVGAKVRPLINWPAFLYTFVTMMLISVTLAITVAVPYQWWAFRPEVLTGVVVRAWWGLPVEQILLYMLFPWLAILWFEMVFLWYHAEDGPFRVRWFTDFRDYPATIPLSNMMPPMPVELARALDPEHGGQALRRRVVEDVAAPGHRERVRARRAARKAAKAARKAAKAAKAAGEAPQTGGAPDEPAGG